MSRIVKERFVFIPLCINCDHIGFCRQECQYPGKTSLLWGDTSGRCCDAERLPTWPFDILFNACGRRGRWWKPKKS
ncbi:MAG: hypothetical protein WC503_04025 [Candidatus Shapirobacteria bacterium]